MKNKYYTKQLLIILVSIVFVRCGQEPVKNFANIHSQNIGVNKNIISDTLKKQVALPETSQLEATVLNENEKVQTTKDKSARQIIINQPSIKYYYHDYGYLQGMLYGPGNLEAELYVGGEKIRNNEGKFSTFAKRPAECKDDEWAVAVEAHFKDGQVLSTKATYETILKEDYRTGEKYYAPANAQMIHPQSKETIKLAGAGLYIVEGAVKENTIISVTGLRQEDMPIVSSDISNVTSIHSGYRFLPDGTHFEKELVLAMEYDKSEIPSGYRPDDIYTFYYNEDVQRWQQIPRDSIDEENGIIYSRTNHFTDYINGVLKAPETSDAMAYTPLPSKAWKRCNL